MCPQTVYYLLSFGPIGVYEDHTFNFWNDTVMEKIAYATN